MPGMQRGGSASLGAISSAPLVAFTTLPQTAPLPRRSLRLPLGREQPNLLVSGVSAGSISEPLPPSAPPFPLPVSQVNEVPLP